LSAVGEDVLAIAVSLVLLPFAFVFVAEFTPLVVAPAVEHAHLLFALVDVSRVEILLPVVVAQPVFPVAHLLGAVGPVLDTERLTFVLGQESVQDVSIGLTLLAIAIDLSVVETPLFVPLQLHCVEFDLVN